MSKDKIQLKIARREINGFPVFDVTDQHGGEYEMIHAIEFEKTGRFVTAKAEFIFKDEEDDLPCGKYRLEPQHIPHTKK